MTVPESLVPMNVLAGGLANPGAGPAPPRPAGRLAELTPEVTPAEAGVSPDVVGAFGGGAPPLDPAAIPDFSKVTPAKTAAAVQAAEASVAPRRPVVVGAPALSPPTAPAAPSAEPPRANLAALAERMSSPGAAVKVPAHSELQGFSVKRQAPISPEAKAAVEEGFLWQADAAEEGARMLAANAAQAAAGFERQRQNAEGELDSLKKMEAARDEALRPKIADLSRRAEEIRSFRVDPNRYWKQKGQLAEVLAHIGAGLMEAGRAFAPGMRNIAYESIKERVDGAVAAQEAELGAMKAGYDAEVNVLAELRSQFLSPEAASAATRSLLMTVAEAESKRIAAMSGSPEAIARGKELAAKFGLDAAQWRAKAEELEKGEIGETFKHFPDAVRYVGGGNPALAFLSKRAKTYQAMGHSAEDSRVLAGRDFAEAFGVQPGRPAMTGLERKGVEAQQTALAKHGGGPALEVPGLGAAPTVKEAQELRTSQAAYWGIKAKLAQYKKLNTAAARFGGFGVGTDAYKEARSLAEDLKLDYAKVKTGGVVTESDKQNAAAVVPDFTSVTGDNVALRTFEKQLDTQYEQSVRARVRDGRSLPREQIFAPPPGVGDAPKAPVPEGFTPTKRE